MFYFLSKLLTFLIQPIGIIIGILVISLLLKNHTKRRNLILFSILLTYIFSNSLIVNSLAMYYEDTNAEIELKPNYDFGVVLTGGIIQNGIEGIHLNDSGDRIWQALELYRKHKINKILITGGSQNPKSSLREESVKSKIFLEKNGVPSKDIILELEALNTYENAQKTAKYFNDQKIINPSIILISSAFHKKRAQACFLKAGLSTDYFPCSYISNPNIKPNILNIMPSSAAFRDTDLLFKEWSGYIIYKLMSYL